jgi:hypothetical protein
MKVFVQEKECTIDGKKIVYNEFSTPLPINGFDDFKLLLKIEDKMAKVLLADNIESADFGLKITNSKGVDYYNPVINFRVNNKEYNTKVKLTAAELLLVRISLRG